MAHPAWRLAIILLAALALCLHGHALFFSPELARPQEFQGALAVQIVLMANSEGFMGAPGFARFTIGLVAVTGIAASLLASAIAWRSAWTPTARRLAVSLALASWAAAYFFVFSAHPYYRGVLGDAAPSIVVFLLADFLGYSAGLLSPFLLLRFFIGYPRAPTPPEWEAHFARLQAQDQALTSGSQLLRSAPQWATAPRATEALIGAMGSWLPRLDTARPIPWLMAMATGLSLTDAFGSQALSAALWAAVFVVMLAPISLFVVALRYHHRNAIAEDRLKIEWIYGTVRIGARIWCLVGPLWWLLLFLGLERLEAWGLHAPPGIQFVGPIIIATQLYVLAILLALALSIFYRGTVDPRLAIGRVTLVGAVTVAIALLFLLLERLAAMTLARWLDLPAETGSIAAMVVVAVTVKPLMTRAEGLISGIVLRFLPLESVVAGQRVDAAIALSDLTGYTALSAADEGQALLVAALLQRQAAMICHASGGRVVKSMGDAVLVAFKEAAGAAEAITKLHQGFPQAARALGLPELAVHSGAHLGTVTLTRDGDVYGQVVNISARLQALAKPGELVVSDAFVQAAQMDPTTYRSLGSVNLKNVPEPIECRVITSSAQPRIVRRQPTR